MNVIKRPSIVYIDCPECKEVIAITPVFRMFKGTRYEAWAKFWFEEDKTGRPPCRIIYEGKEDKPSTAAKAITNNDVNGWFWWKCELGEQTVTLNELANFIA